MPHVTFTSEVADQLDYYVYRLIDPRNGDTFYVGKGKGDRVFAHVRGALAITPDETNISLKFQRIREIHRAQLEVGHIIHRHGIKDEKVAYEVEAALIDAYPGLHNDVGGHRSDEYGCRHAEEIIAKYQAKPLVAFEPLILVTVSRTQDERSPYDSARAAWRLDRNKASRYRLVLGQSGGIIISAFRPEEWLVATRANFPWLEEDLLNRIGFRGRDVDEASTALYVGRRVPSEYRGQVTARYMEVGAEAEGLA